MQEQKLDDRRHHCTSFNSFASLFAPFEQGPHLHQCGIVTFSIFQDKDSGHPLHLLPDFYQRGYTEQDSFYLHYVLAPIP